MILAGRDLIFVPYQTCLLGDESLTRLGKNNAINIRRGSIPNGLMAKISPGIAALDEDR